jgi:Tol biopolymer transport system component
MLALLVAIACSDDAPSAPATPAPVATVTVSPLTQTIIVGQTTTLTAALADAAGNPITGRAVTWASNDPAVATVSATGVVTALAEGAVQIDATSEGKYGTGIVVVSRAPVATVAITQPALSLSEGEASTLTAVAKDANGAVLQGRTITWTSNNAAVSVDAAGTVTAISAGVATITAESEEKTATIQVTVAALPVANVVVSALPALLEPGDQPALTVRLTDAAGRTVTGRAVTWISSNPTVATVSSTGVVSALAAGLVTITATSEGKTGSATATVDAAPSADLLYQRTSPTANELFVLGFGAGAAPRALNAGSVSHQPTVSPDGTRLAFYVSMVGPIGDVVEDIFAVDRTGMNMKRLTSTAGVDNAPAWSPAPGANVIAYQHLEVTNGRSDIWLMNSDGTNARNLTADLPGDLTRGEPAWSPDGQWIAFTSSRSTAGPGRGSIWIMRADGSAKRQLTVHPGNGFDLAPSWSPDGQRIAFQRGGISIVTVATGAVATLDLPGTSTHPSWSPDGRHIAFAWRPSEPGSGRWELYTVRPDGSGMRLRTTNAQWGGGVSPTWIAR